MESTVQTLAGVVYLRPIQEADTEQVVAWRNKERVRHNFIYQKPFTKEGHLNWLRTQVEPGHVVQFIICEKDSERSVGSVYFRDIDRKKGCAEYGIFIGEGQARGRGLGTAAAKLMLRYCFREAGLHRVYLRALADNVQAIRSYEKAGFVREGYLRDDVRIEGEYRDIVWMAALGALEAQDGRQEVCGTV